MKNKNTDMKNRFADRGKSHAGYFLRFVFCLVLTAAASLAQAQNRNQVSGKVTDKAGEPLIGATVVVVGTTTGATTGADGRFTIGVPVGGELKISYIGYVEQTVIYDKSYHILICIMRDVTVEAKERESREAMSRTTMEITDKVIEKQMRVAQNIASILGETTAETKATLTHLKNMIINNGDGRV